jgi:hypothetical protein
VGAAVAAGGGSMLSGCARSKEQQFEELVSKGVEDEDIETLAVAPEQLVEAADFDEVPFGNYLSLQTTLEAPLGSLFYQIDSAVALILLPGERGGSFRKLGMFDLHDGSITTVVSKPVGTGKNVIIYDARASRTALIWTELDLGTYGWNTYVASLNGTTVGEAWMVEEGDAEWEPSMLAVAGSKVYWTVMPVATGAANLEDSRLFALELTPGGAEGGSAIGSEGGSATSSGSAATGTGSAATGTGSAATPATAPTRGEPYAVLTSHGRMITNPLVTDGIVTFVPRVDTANVYYQLTALDCVTDKPVDFRVLPQSLRVTEALYLKGAFTFSIEDNYDYAGGLKRFGTYQDLGDGSYLHVSRPPMSPVVRFGDCLVLKSATNIVGFDPLSRKSFIIEKPPRSADFGETLIGWGVQDKVVTSSIRMSEAGGVMEATTIRVFG